MIGTFLRRLSNFKLIKIHRISQSRTSQSQYLFAENKNHELNQNTKEKTQLKQQSLNKIQDKNNEQTSQLDRLSDQLKKIEVSNQSIQVISLKPDNQNQIQSKFQLRVFKTYFTITFLPKKQLLDSTFQKQYNANQDNLLTIYKFTCKKCKHKSMRSFPQNGYKYGTVITGCSKCHQILLVSDNLGWIQPQQIMNFINKYGVAVKDILQVTRKVNNYLIQLGLKTKRDYNQS